jgi:hypothetical protein
MFIFFTLYLLIYKISYDKISYNYKLTSLVIYIIQLSSYTYTFLKNPGIPKKELEILDINNNNDHLYVNLSLNETLKEIKDHKICRICNIIIHKNINTNHCIDCDVCIEGIN